MELPFYFNTPFRITGTWSRLRNTPRHNAVCLQTKKLQATPKQNNPVIQFIL